MAHIGTYHNKSLDFENFYTGTRFQPDDIQIFVKSGKDNKRFHCYELNSIANWMGFLPVVSIFTGMIRINNAVKTIFHELSQLKTKEKEAHQAELWNAFKNLFRGIVEVIPLTGITLVIFDCVRMSIRTGRIAKTIENTEDIAGIAIDGKIIGIFSLEKIKTLFSEIIKKYPGQADEACLEVVKLGCLGLIEKKVKKEDSAVDLVIFFPILNKLF